MTNMPLTFSTLTGLQYCPTPTSCLLRLGRREMFICRDFRNRYYNVNPIIDFGAGIEPGHLEILLFRKWLIILSKSR